MAEAPVVERVEIVQFSYAIANMGFDDRYGFFGYVPGSTFKMTGNGIRLHTNFGVTGEYVGGHGIDYAAIPGFVSILFGRSALDREHFYRRAKYLMRQGGHLGFNVVDIALWDLAGKFFNAPVYELLGGRQRRIPCYASTYPGDEYEGGLNSPEAYADFAEQCLELGYPGFKIHGWMAGSVERQIATVHAVGKRVAGRMDLMLDPACALETFADALKLGQAADEYGFTWYEDPFKDGGVSASAHRKLRELIKTPLLQMEHLRGLEQKVDFIAAEGTDLVRGDPEFDGGITGALKLAHAAEGFGLDVEYHWCGPAHRHLLGAVKNSNFYEMALVHPHFGFVSAASYVSPDYRDALDAVDADGCVPIPEGPGLGVTYDWDYIYANRTGGAEYP